ncbi:MAG: trypsin-like peptidase domain-containing protein [Bdellovibrionales bacterium]|nr:trypsin-like peptidase domain-containing protein [Bdellovibrionales bacterium]
MDRAFVSRFFWVTVLGAFPVFQSTWVHAAAAPSATVGIIGPTVIYGVDNRRDPYEVTEQIWLDKARSTVALFSSKSVLGTTTSGATKIKTTSYAQDYNLCTSEPYYDQDTGAFCSGSLVGDDLVLTAGHCITSSAQDLYVPKCKDTKFVFDFGIWSKGSKTPGEVPTTSVYGCKQVIARVEQATGADYALVRLDRKVTDRPALAVNRLNNTAIGDPMLVIGHPAGLPTKIAGGAVVLSFGRGYFNADLDTYGGNSGSAVFNEKTGLIEGILVRGAMDYVESAGKGSCVISNVISSPSVSGGESVTSVSIAVPNIP